MNRSLWRATDSGRPRARSSTAACIDGTAVYHVGSSSSSQSKKCTWWKPGAHATEPPARREARRAVTRPWMWKSGMTFRHRSDGSSRSVSATFRAETASWRCVSGTSFGRDVVPDVWSARATVARLGPVGRRPVLRHAVEGEDPRGLRRIDVEVEHPDPA